MDKIEKLAQAIADRVLKGAREDKGMQSEWLYATYVSEGSEPGLSNITILGETFTDIPRWSSAFAVDGPTLRIVDNTTQTNLTNTTSGPGDPDLTGTFVAPSSGRVEVEVYGGIRDDTGTDRATLGWQIREDTSTGSIVGSANVTAPVDALLIVGAGVENYNYQSAGGQIVTGLQPGRTYFTRVTQRCQSGDGTADIFNRALTILGVPGPPPAGTQLMCLRTKLIPLTICGVLSGKTI